MIVDQLWAVVGTTNFDMMSFEYLDEINLAVRNEAFARDAQERPLKAFDGPISDDAANRPSKVLARLSKGPRPSARSWTIT